MDAPNSSQISGQLRLALAVGGPIAAVILAKTGWSQADYAMYVECFIAIAPYAISAAWSWYARRNAAVVKDASNVQGATVVIDTTAAPAVQEVARNDAAPDVMTAAAYERRSAAR